MACLDDATLDDLVQGRLSGELLHSAEQHLDACRSCSELVAVLAGGSPPDGTELPRGANVGRHVVVERLGHGAMGVVYLAYDPELDRRVALKLIRPGASPALAERMLREAQAMARLAHPNVVAIFDVGRSEGGVYLAMEYVAGRTLSSWLAAAPRSAAEILAVFLQAGRGLAAAHAAGIVHRDFKPDNVLVGDDARVRVTDFGLAHAEPGDAGLHSVARLGAGEPVTRTHGLIGTPAYMAPEQLRGEPATEQSDQFSFAVSLVEALTKRRPFTGATLEDLLAAIERGAVAGQLEAVPRHAKIALARALAARPEARHPSLSALLAEIERRPRRVLPWFALGLTLLAVAAIVALRLEPRAADPCAGGDGRIGEVWGEARKTRVRSAFLATGGDLAPVASERVANALDEHAASWRRQYRSTCEATHVRHEQSDAALDARMRCLDRGLTALAALVATFESADRSVVEHALAATLELPAPEECARVDSLAAMDPRPADPTRAARLEELERRLIDARANAAAGRYSEATASAARLEAEADAVGFRPARAEARLLSAVLARRTGELEPAARHARAALSLAEASRAESVAARAWLEILAIDGARGRPRSVIESAELARAAIARLGDPAELRASLLAASGAARTLTGELDMAERELSESLELRARAFGERSIQVSRTLTAQGNLMRARGKPSEALALHQRALAIDMELLSKAHPAIATHHHNVAGALRVLGRREQALQSYASALAIEKRALGPTHPAVGLTENSIAIALLEGGAIARAREHLGRALAILEAKQHPDRALVLVNLGIADARQREHRRALERFDAALALSRQSLGNDAERIAGILEHRARSAAAIGDLGAARRDRKEALRILELHVAHSAEAVRLREEIRSQAGTSRRARSSQALGSTTYGAQPSWETE